MEIQQLYTQKTLQQETHVYSESEVYFFEIRDKYDLSILTYDKGYSFFGSQPPKIYKSFGILECVNQQYKVGDDSNSFLY